VPLRTRILDQIRDHIATHDAPAPPELLDPYLDFLKGMWAQGVFEIDAVIKNVGLQDDRITAYDVIDSGTNFANHLPRSAGTPWDHMLGQMRDDNETEMKGFWRDELKRMLPKKYRKLVDQTIQVFTDYQYRRFQEFYVGVAGQKFADLWNPV